MARKRPRRRPAGSTVAQQGRSSSRLVSGPSLNDSGVMVNVRHIATGDEGVLYTHRIVERVGHQPRGTFGRLFHRRRHFDDDYSEPSDGNVVPYRQTLKGNIMQPESDTTRSPAPQSDTLRAFPSFYGNNQKQYTVASKKRYHSKFLNWLDKHHLNVMDWLCHSREVDNSVYSPSTSLYRYIDWTFGASFTSVFMTFLIIYLVLCVVFGWFLLIAGNAEPNCIVATGAPFGTTPNTKFSDAFALSWTTFTTVGYGMTYTSTGADFDDTKPHECSWVVFLCTAEAFMGLLFAGMGAAILFGKVNRVQSHANIIFSNAVCLQYEEMDDDILDTSDTAPPTPTNTYPVPIAEEDEENQAEIDTSPQSLEENKFVDQFNGCPVLKFQVVNKLGNREGGELVDCIMKVVGIKLKGPEGRITHSQYVRVNLVDFEHPFLSRVWHGVHILDSTSPLLTDKARQRIRENNGSWPHDWFDPDIIQSKLEFHDMIVTVAGLSNVSAVTVHAYKRYKIGDVLIGYDFAPLVFRDVNTGLLEVDLSVSNDVREQHGMRGEDLSIRRTGSKEQLSSNIRIKKSKSGDGFGSITSQQSTGSKGLPSSIHSSRAGSLTESPETPASIHSSQAGSLTEIPETMISPSETAEPDTPEVAKTSVRFRERDSIVEIEGNEGTSK